MPGEQGSHQCPRKYKDFLKGQTRLCIHLQRLLEILGKAAKQHGGIDMDKVKKVLEDLGAGDEKPSHVPLTSAQGSERSKVRGSRGWERAPESREAQAGWGSGHKACVWGQ